MTAPHADPTGYRVATGVIVFLSLGAVFTVVVFAAGLVSAALAVTCVVADLFLILVNLRFRRWFQ